MSSYLAVNVVSGALRRLLWSAYDAEAAIRTIVGSEAAITFGNPTETARNPANRLSLWLYQVRENEHVKNAPPVPANGHDTSRPTPLALDLSYLVTPFTPSGESDQLLLGMTMQVLYDHSIVVVREPADSVAEELRIVFCRLELEELTRIWEALREPYRLSVCYLVRVVRIDSAREFGHGRVIEADAGFTPLTPAGDGP